MTHIFRRLGSFLLLSAALGTTAAGALSNGDMVHAAASGSVQGGDHRVIVRFAAESVDLRMQMQEFSSREGVVHVKTLEKLGMAVIGLSSKDAQERLLDELDEDASVELAVPDTFVSVDDFKPSTPSDFDPAIASQRRALAAARHTASDRRQCSANAACAARGLVGECCPVADGTMLSCCSMHDEPSTVTLRSVHRTYVTASPAGSVVARSDQGVDTNKFSIIQNDDKTVSFRTSFGTYLTAEASGWLRSDRRTIGDWERFTLLYTDDNGTFAIKTFHSKYVSVEPTGYVVANRPTAVSWEHFFITKVPGPHQRLPNDPNLGRLWGMHSWAANDIDAPEAWKIWTGEQGAGITVGVIDTGIDYTHEDLREQMWVNPNEIPGNGIDDDGNGHIDDVHGADFANNDGDPMDDQLHGTHCSGTIAGIGDNGVGVAGVAWRGVRLMALKFLAGDGSGRTSDAIRAIDYAIAHGAKILSNSWGGGGSSSALRVAIERAEAAGLLFIAAAGNSGTDNDEEPHYPSNYDVANLVSVASTDPGGALSSFSCYGRDTVHVAAPGSQIFSSVPGGGYKYLSGTSMATPHVTGIAALVWMYRPQLSMQQVKQILLDSVEKYDTLDGRIITGGLANAKNALETAWAFDPPNPPKNAPRAIAFVDEDPAVGAYSGVITINAAADESDIEYYRVYFVSKAGFQLEPLGEPVLATGASELTLNINGSFAMPSYAIALVAVSGRGAGENHAKIGEMPHVMLDDFAIPELQPKSVKFGGDVDLRSGRIDGKVFIGRAAQEASISHYNIYWRNATGLRGPLAGVVPAMGFSEPTCSGASCDVVDIDRQGEVYVIDRAAYGDSEGATIALSGPADVIVTRLSTEEYYDTLTVGGQELSGNMATSLPLTVSVAEGPSEIVWLSDASVGAGGWTIRLVQKGAIAVFHINSTAALADGLEIISAFGKNEFQGDGLRVKLVDQTTDMPPSRAFKPASVSFQDVHPGSGVISGNVSVEPAEGATAGGVISYEVTFGGADGKPIGKRWTINADGASVVKLVLQATQVPDGAVQLLVRAGGHHGFSDEFASTPLVDVFPQPPTNASWSGDNDGRPGWLAGDIIVEAAESEAGIIDYIAYWYLNGKKGTEVGRKSPKGYGIPTVLHFRYGTATNGTTMIVVSNYAWGEMEEGVLVDMTDFDSDRRLSEDPVAAGAVPHAAFSGKPPREPVPENGAEPWIPFRSADVVAASHWAAQPVAAQGAVAKFGRVKSSVSLSGMTAREAVTATARAAVARAVASLLPEGDAARVHVISVSDKPAVRGPETSAGGVRFEFLVDASPDGGAAGLDRVEARLIRLSSGNVAAERVVAALTRELRRPLGRASFAEPAHLSARLVALAATRGRKLSILTEERSPDASIAEDAEEEPVSDALSFAAAAGGATCAIVGAAVSFLVVCAVRRRMLSWADSGKAAQTRELLQGVCVDSSDAQ